MKSEEIKVKREEVNLEHYLAGQTPLHADRLTLPSDEELDAVEAEFDRIIAERKQSAHRIPLWPWTAAAVAAVLVAAVLLWPDKRPLSSPEQPTLISQTSQTTEHRPVPPSTAMENTEATSQPLVVEDRPTPSPQKERQQSDASQPSPVPTCQPAVPSQPFSCEYEPSELQPTAQADPITHSDEVPPQNSPPPLPQNRQALADIYLAEVALQVAYKQRAVQEAVSAYQTSIITGEEPAQPIIAF